MAMALEPDGAPSHGPAAAVYAGTVVSAGQALDADPVTTDLRRHRRSTRRSPMTTSGARCSTAPARCRGCWRGPAGRGVDHLGLPPGRAGPRRGPAARRHPGAVDHGWLGVDASDADPPTTTSVMPAPPRPRPRRVPGSTRSTAGGPAAVGGHAARATSSPASTATRSIRAPSSTTRLYRRSAGDAVTVTLEPGRGHRDQRRWCWPPPTPMHRGAAHRRSMRAWHRLNPGTRATRSNPCSVTS